MHRYIYNRRDFNWKVTGTAAFCVVAGVYSVLMIFRGNPLFWVFPPVCVYQLWNTFGSLSNPQVVEVDEGEGILRFSAFGRSHSYRVEEVTVFLVKELEPHKKFYLRVEDRGGKKGRYWIPCKYMEKGEELWDYCAWLEHQKDPSLLKFRARKPPENPYRVPEETQNNNEKVEVTPS